MTLSTPIDFEILDAMEDGTRQTAPNLAVLLEYDRGYVNNRLAALERGGFLRKVGPADNSGICEISERGKLALEYEDSYSRDTADTFRATLERQLSE